MTYNVTGDRSSYHHIVILAHTHSKQDLSLPVVDISSQLPLSSGVDASLASTAKSPRVEIIQGHSNNNYVHQSRQNLPELAFAGSQQKNCFWKAPRQGPSMSAKSAIIQFGFEKHSELPGGKKHSAVCKFCKLKLTETLGTTSTFSRHLKAKHLPR